VGADARAARLSGPVPGREPRRRGRHDQRRALPARPDAALRDGRLGSAPRSHDDPRRRARTGRRRRDPRHLRRRQPRHDRGLAGLRAAGRKDPRRSAAGRRWPARPPGLVDPLLVRLHGAPRLPGPRGAPREGLGLLGGRQGGPPRGAAPHPGRAPGRVRAGGALGDRVRVVQPVLPPDPAAARRQPSRAPLHAAPARRGAVRVAGRRAAAAEARASPRRGAAREGPDRAVAVRGLRLARGGRAGGRRGLPLARHRRRRPQAQRRRGRARRRARRHAPRRRAARPVGPRARRAGLLPRPRALGSGSTTPAATRRRPRPKCSARPPGAPERA
jgi:hypothetical protein